MLDDAVGSKTEPTDISHAAQVFDLEKDEDIGSLSCKMWFSRHARL